MLTFIKNMMIKRLFNPQLSSFSQAGEDKIINIIAKIIGLKKLSYLDIGASHPIYLSNTFYFYLLGNTGVCIEANSARVKMLKQARPKDTCLHLGVCAETDPDNPLQTFYVMASAALSSFSKQHVEATDQQPTHAEEVQMIGINDLLATHCQRTPNLVSLDVEGMDLAILKAWDFKVHRPEIFCLETLSYSETDQVKLYDIIEFMTSCGYIVVADTYINTILVRADAWKKVRPRDRSTIYTARSLPVESARRQEPSL